MLLDEADIAFEDHDIVSGTCFITTIIVFSNEK